MQDIIAEIQKKYSNLHVADLLDACDSQGKYQLFVIWSLCAICVFQGFIVYSFSYLFFEPSFTCLGKNDKEFECSQEEACKNKWGFRIHSGRFAFGFLK